MLCHQSLELASISESKDITAKKNIQLSTYEEELRQLGKQQWDYTRLRWKLVTEITSSCQERAFQGLQKGFQLVPLCMVATGLCWLC